MTQLPLTADAPAARSSQDQAWPKPAYAYFVLAVLVASSAFAVLDRTAIGLLVDPIKRDLHVSDTQMGLLQGFAFAICYTVFGLPLGILTDRWKRRPLLTCGVFVWSLATSACGFAGSFAALFGSRVAVGIGEASLAPASGSLIADYFPSDRRPRAFGIWMLGSSIGVGMSSLLAAVAFQASDSLRAAAPFVFGGAKDWQLTFLLIGAPGLLLALLIRLTVKEPRRQGVTTAGKPSFRGLWATLSDNAAAYLTLGGGAVLNIICIYAQVSWLPTLFMRVFHWSQVQVGPPMTVIALTFGMGGALAAGGFMTALSRRGRFDGPVIAAMGHAAATLVFGVAGCLAARPEITLACVAITAITSNWSNAAAMTALNQITPNQQRGQVLAIYTLFTGLISMTAGGLLVGLLTDNIYKGPTGVAPALATVYAGCTLLSLIVLTLGRKAYARAEQRGRALEAAS